VRAIGKEIKELAIKARDRNLDPLDLQGSTFTISNAGSVGGVHATAIINYPETALLFVGKMYDKAVVEDGVVMAKKVLPLSLTFDHRVIDGADAARFMNDLKEQLKHLDNILE